MNATSLVEPLWVLAAFVLLESGQGPSSTLGPPERRWRNSSLAGLKHIGSALLIARSPMEALLARGEAEGRLVRQVSAEKVLAPVLARLSMPDDLLVHGAYQLAVKPTHPNAKTVVEKWGSSYSTWCMPLDKWKLAPDFLWYLQKDLPLPFPILWDKKPEFCGEVTHVLTIQGTTYPVPVEKLDAYLKAASQWVTPESLPAEEVLKMLRSDALEKRISAVRLLGARKDPQYIPTIVDSFKDQSLEVRRAAVWALGMIGGPPAIAHLQANARDPSSILREEIALALGEIGGPATVEPLARLLKDRDHDVRKNAAAAMAATGSDKAIPYLVEALGDQDEATRHAALESLIQLGWRPPKE